MASYKTIEQQIEQRRLEMYQAYSNGNNPERVLEVSKELDTLLNQLDDMEKRNK